MQITRSSIETTKGMCEERGDCVRAGRSLVADLDPDTLPVAFARQLARGFVTTSGGLALCPERLPVGPRSWPGASCAAGFG